LTEIEKQLNWITQRFKIPKTTGLLNKIRKDEFYSLYRLLVGDLTTSLKRGESWVKVEEEQEKGIEAEFKKIKKADIEKWNKKLNSIAKYKDVIDEWKLSRFNAFLQKIAREKSEIAKIILDDVFENAKPLKTFTNQFLFGFRQNNNLKIWDDYAKKIVEEKDINLVKDIPNSFFYITDLENIREEDIDLLSQIIEKEKQFVFLKKLKKNELLNLNFSLMRVLIRLYRKDKKQIETLIRTLIENDKDKQYLYMYLEQLGFPAYKNEIDLSEWSKENIEFILDELVEFKNLSYKIQLLLLAIARFNFKSAMDVFVRRIRKRDEVIERKEKRISFFEYDAIPYHFNNELIEHIETKKNETVDLIKEWAMDMTLKSSVYNIELAQFVQRIGNSFESIISELTEQGGKENLQRAVSLMWSTDPSDIGLCFEIIKNTDEKTEWGKKIWDTLGGIMHNTGVVSGEYGIAEAHERKAKDIEDSERYKVEGTKKEKERVEKFKKKIAKELKERAKQERQRAEEEIKLRKLEFEG